MGLKPKSIEKETSPVLSRPLNICGAEDVLKYVIMLYRSLLEFRGGKREKKMKASIYGIAVVVMLAAVPLGTPTEQLSSRECENLGFTGLALCSDCNTFADYVKDKGQSPYPFLSQFYHVCVFCITSPFCIILLQHRTTLDMLISFSHVFGSTRFNYYFADIIV